MGTIRSSRRNRRAFAFADLCAVLVILVLMFTTMVAFRRNALERDGLIHCAGNLKNIAAAMIMYANTNNGRYPRTYYDRNSAKTTEYTGVNASNPFGPSGPDANDVTSPMFLLVRTTGIAPKTFICPSTYGEPYDPAKLGPIAAHSNFTSRQNLTYSMNNPYPTMKAITTQWVWDSTLSSDFAIASDMNPGGAALATLTPNMSTEQMRVGNSLNHGGRGQNVLYGDYHVAWQPTPFCGSPRSGAMGSANDNIFTSNETVPTVGGQAQDNLDSVMVPLSTAGFQPPEPKVPARMLVMVGGVTLLIVGAVVWLIISVFKKKPPLAHRTPPPIP